MALSAQDHARLLRAIALADGAIGLCEPNPRVGCVLHDAAGHLAGEGFTQQAGGPHAEVMALRQAAAHGRSVKGGTAWVSLEPCAHHGRTPPCADALVSAGLARVVVGTTDPFASVAGRGLQRLRAAGVRVDLAEPGLFTQAAMALNIGFFSRVLRQRPWVRMKLAASLDGRTALPDGRSQWITGAAARADGHAWRRRAGALLTGSGTILHDDPRLDVRLAPTTVQPLRVVLDSRLRMSDTAQVLASDGRCLVIHVADEPERAAALQRAGAQLHRLAGADGQVDLHALLRLLTHEKVNELHVEAGATLNAALLQAGLVDELLLYLAPKLLGPGLGLAKLPQLDGLPGSNDWQFVQTRPLGEDMMLRLQSKESLAQLS